MNSNLYVCIMICIVITLSCSETDKKVTNENHSSPNVDSLSIIISVLEQENKEIVEENDRVKHENSLYTYQNEYIKNITREYNSIDESISKILEDQLTILKNTNDIESNINNIKLSTSEKVKRYLSFAENSFKRNNQALAVLETRLAKERNRALVLENELSTNKLKIINLEKMMNNLSSEIKKRDELIFVLKEKINNLSSLIVELNNELNTAYYIYGTEEYLIQNNILTKEGGVDLGLFSFGEVLVPVPGYNLSKLFKKIDIREVDKISLLNHDEYILIPSRNNGSYSFSYDRFYKRYYLQIYNKESFWRDRFLIIVDDD